MSDITYDVNDEFDEVFDEKGNVVLAARLVSWNGNPAKLELRKWNITADGQERPNKGFSFLTKEGPDSLVHVLSRRGFGNTGKIINNIKEREDFLPTLKKILGGEVLDSCGVDSKTIKDIKEDSYYDPKEDLF